MKKLLSITLTTLLVLFASQAFGQTVSDEISAQANIISALSVNGEDNLTFGDVIAGNNGTIEVNNDGTMEVTNAGDAQLGRFVLEGSEGEQYELSFDIPENLSDGTNDLPFVMEGSQYGLIEDSNDEDGNFDPDSGVDVEFSTSNITVLLGGEVQPASGQESGAYTGTVTLQATPTSF